MARREVDDVDRPDLVDVTFPPRPGPPPELVGDDPWRVDQPDNNDNEE